MSHIKNYKTSLGSTDPHLAVSYWLSAEGKQKEKSIEEKKSKTCKKNLYGQVSRSAMCMFLFVYLIFFLYFLKLHSKSTWPENL